MIRLKPDGRERASISPEFTRWLTAIRERQTTRLEKDLAKLEKQLKARLQNDPTLRKRYADAKIRLELYTRPAGEGMTATRGGLDYDLTRLRQLPFLFYTTKSYHDGAKRHGFLAAKTAPLTTVIDDTTRGYSNDRINEEHHGTYTHGPYFIFIALSKLGSQVPLWHIIPERNPSTACRHPHARVGFGDNHDISGNPLSHEQQTCWGNFGGIANVLWASCDVPEIFRLLHRFASEINPNSLMIQTRDVPGLRFRSFA